MAQMQGMSGGSQPTQPGVPGQMVPQTGMQQQNPMETPSSLKTEQSKPQNQKTTNMKV